MRKIFILTLLMFSLIANDSYEVKLLEKVLPLLFQKETLNVYADKKVTRLLKQSQYLYLVKKCEDADIIVGRYFKNLDGQCVKKPFFTTYYREFKNNPDTIGAFYWRKGRPQIRFHKNTIKEKNLYLDISLEKYAQ